MNFLNLKNSTLIDVRVRASPAEHVAAWLQLLSYCIVKENNGVIRNALNWSDKEWLHTVAVDKGTMTEASKLWRWRKSDLIVWEYPRESQHLVVAKRVGGREGARRKWAKKKTAKASPASSTPSSTPKGTPSSTPNKDSQAPRSRSPDVTPNGTPHGSPLGVLMRKGKEGKGIGKKRNGMEKEVSPEHAEILFELYPRHVGKRAALTTISSALERVSYNQLRSRVQAYRTAVDAWPPEQLEFCPNPATWFREGRYDDDPATWAAKPRPKHVAAADEVDHFNPNAPYAHTGGVPVV